MSKHNETGINGENIAANFLLKSDYIILHRNWRHGKKEIDVIAQKGDLLVFIEIKTRTSFDFGFPEEAVTLKKQSYLKAAAEVFLENNPQFLKSRFDIVSVLLDRGAVKEIVHFEDAFY
jgi:putative endonuclease